MYQSLFDDININYNTQEKRITRDNFIQNIYYYYLKGGFYSIIISKILDIFSFLFLSTFIMIVFVFLDWGNILKCGKEFRNDDCGDISLYLTFNGIYNPNFFHVIIFIFVSGSLLFSFYKLIKFFVDCKEFVSIDKYYTGTLKIKRKDLSLKSWNDIINAISETSDNIPIDEITSIILKKENYFIALLGFIFIMKNL